MPTAQAKKDGHLENQKCYLDLSWTPNNIFDFLIVCPFSPGGFFTFLVVVAHGVAPWPPGSDSSGEAKEGRG